MFSNFDDNLILLSSYDKDIALFDIKSVKQIAHLKLEEEAKQVMFANENHIVVCLVNGLVQYLKFAGGSFVIEK